MVPVFNPHSKDWIALKKWLEESIEQMHRGLETCDTWEKAIKFQERVKIYRMILNFENPGAQVD